MSSRRSEKLKQSQLGKWYFTNFTSIPAGTSENAFIDLENDLGIEEDEAILIWQATIGRTTAIESETFVAANINSIYVRPIPYTDAPQEQSLWPPMGLMGIKDAVLGTINIQMQATQQIQVPLLVFQNFYLYCNNFDATNVHSCLYGFLYSVVKIDKVTALDIFELSRRAPGEAT